VDAAIAARLTDLRLEWKDLYAQAGVAQETVRKIRAGIPARPKTESKVEAALGWSRGSLQAIRDGRAPTVTQGEPRGLDAPPATPGSYPRDVAGDPFLERIWDDPFALEDERRAACDGVIAFRLERRRARRAASDVGKGSVERHVR
jgi:hypothetical protein